MEEWAVRLADGYLLLWAYLGSGTIPFKLQSGAFILEREMHRTLARFFFGGESLKGIDMATQILHRSLPNDTLPERESVLSTT